MGVINDPRMGDKVQIILVITGLGAPSLEDAFSSVKRPTPEANRVAAGEKDPPGRQPSIRLPVSPPEDYRPVTEVRSPQPPVLENAFAAQSLDLPAFLRRRARNSE